MGLRLTYLLACRVVSWMVLLARSDTDKHVEILVLRHQLAIENPTLGQRSAMSLDR